MHTKYAKKFFFNNQMYTFFELNLHKIRGRGRLRRMIWSLSTNQWVERGKGGGGEGKGSGYTVLKVSSTAGSCEEWCFFSD